jgi:type I restriction enzyme S subunit
MTKKSDAPAIRFKGFSDAWEQRKLGDIASDMVAGGDIDKDLILAEGQYPVIANALTGDGIVGYYDKEYRVNAPAVTVTGRGDVGHAKARLVNFTPVVRLLSVKSEHDVFFLENAINTLKIVIESTGVPQLTVPQLAKYEVAFPRQLDEEEHIGAFFKQLDYLITLHQRKFEKLTNVKKSMLEKMFPQNGSSYPEIRFKGFTDPWEQRKLGELGTITTGNTPSTSIPDYYSDDGIVWITPTDICENITFESARKLSDLGQQVGRVVPKNTILVTCIASIGKNTMLGNTGSFNQQINGLTPNENKYDPYFLLTESALWSAKMKGSAAAGTMQIVNRTEFSELKTWLPSLIEQQAIGAFFKQLDHLITLHQRELEKLQNIKKSMLEKMFV